MTIIFQILDPTRNSAVAEKPRDAFVQMQWRGWLRQTRPSTYVLPCQIWSFYIKRCGHKCGRTPKIGERWNSALLGWEAWLTPRYTPNPTCVTTSNLVVLRQRVCINKTEPPVLGRAGLLPFRYGRGWPPLEIHPSPRVIVVPNVVVLGQTIPALLRRSVRKIWPLASCLSRSLEVIGTDRHRSAAMTSYKRFIATMSLSPGPYRRSHDFYPRDV